MGRKIAQRLSAIAFGLTVCLTSPACRTCHEKGCDSDKVSASSDAVRDVIRKLNEIIIPEMTFFSPATIIDAVDFFKQASRDYDKPGTPQERRGVSFVLQVTRATQQVNREAVDPFDEVASTNRVAPALAAISVRAISLYDALQLVCNVTDMSFHIQENGGVMLAPKGLSLDEDWTTRSFNIPQLLADHLFVSRKDQVSDADPNKVWKAFFDQLGVTGPSFAEFEYLPTIGKLRVTNTPENLAIIESVFEKFALRMIEVELQIHARRHRAVAPFRRRVGGSADGLAKEWEGQTGSVSQSAYKVGGGVMCESRARGAFPGGVGRQAEGFEKHVGGRSRLARAVQFQDAGGRHDPSGRA